MVGQPSVAEAALQMLRTQPKRRNGAEGQRRCVLWQRSPGGSAVGPLGRGVVRLLGGGVLAYWVARLAVRCRV